MPCEYITLPSTYSMLRRETELVQQAVAAKHKATLIVPDHDLEEARKLLFADVCPAGVEIKTHAHWVEGLWDLYGDGRGLATPEQRHVLVRPLLAELADLDPSSEYVDILAAFIVDCIAAGALCKPGCSEADEKLLGVAARYLEAVEEKGLAEASAVERAMAPMLAGSTIIFEEPDCGRARMRAMIDAVSAHADVWVLQRGIGDGTFADAANELTALRNRLFLGMEGLEPQGMLIAAEAYGAHAEPQLVCDLIAKARQRGLETGDIALCLPDPAAAYPRMLDALAEAHIPFECRFALKLRQTPFGEAFLALKHLRDPEYRDDFAEVAQLVASPYAGIRPEHARAFQAQWRKQAGSDSAARIADLRHGLKGRVPKSGWPQHLLRFENLLEADDLRQCAELMFANAQAAGVGPDRLMDDAAACDALIDYLVTCEELGAAPHDKDIAELTVRLIRASGDVREAVRIAEPGRIGRAGCVIMGRLDQDAYSMARRPMPFDDVLERVGAPVTTDMAQECRVTLLTAISAATRLFMPYRLCHDLEGNEKCQSALWDELMVAYRSGEDATTKVHEPPAALRQRGLAYRLSEDEAFRRGMGDDPAGFAVLRGVLEGAESLELLMPDFDVFNETFSPTALEDYHRCPYRWFIGRRVGAKRYDGRFDQMAKGNLAHDMFRRVYADFAEQGIVRVTEDNLAACLESARESCLAQMRSALERRKLFLLTEREEAEAYEVVGDVLALIARDAGFLPGFLPRYHELELETIDGKGIDYAGVKVRGKVDRIDVDDKGNAVVIDYKLSGLRNGYGFQREGELPDHIQTDIYALLVQRHFEERGEDIRVVGSVYRSYAVNNLRGVYAKGIEWGDTESVLTAADALPNEASMTSYEEYLQRVEAEVAEQMERLRAGSITPAPRCDDACTYCLAAQFCSERRS